MICTKCKENSSYHYEKEIAISNCCNVEAYNEYDRSVWQDLDIKNIPTDFFVNNNYEIEQYKHNNEWCKSFIEDCRRACIISNIQVNGAKYRYRLKPIEVCKITKNMAIELLEKQVVDGMGTNWFIHDGHRVEIIK